MSVVDGIDLAVKMRMNTRLYYRVSETYLSRVFTKLRKSGIVKSIPGVNGRYELARSPETYHYGIFSKP